MSYVLFMIVPATAPGEVSYWCALPLVVMGIGYSFYVAGIYTVLPLSVKPRVLGTAYGMFSMVDNIGFAVIPSVVGALTIKTMKQNTYVWVNILLGGFCLLGLILSIILYIIDKYNNNGVLQNTTIKTSEKKSILETPSTHSEPENNDFENLESRDRITRPLLNPSDVVSNTVRESSL